MDLGDSYSIRSKELRYEFMCWKVDVFENEWVAPGEQMNADTTTYHCKRIKEPGSGSIDDEQLEFIEDVDFDAYVQKIASRYNPGDYLTSGQVQVIRSTKEGELELLLPLQSGEMYTLADTINDELNARRQREANAD